MNSHFGLVAQRISEPYAALETTRFTVIYGQDRDIVIKAYDVRRDIESSVNPSQVARLNELKSSLYDFLKAARGVIKEASANKGIELELPEEIDELAKMLRAEFPLMQKPLAEFEAKNYLWHLRHS